MSQPTSPQSVPPSLAPNLTPSWAMVFAAGKGTRMMPLTLHTPKPMLEVAGEPLLGHTLNRLAQAGIENVVVNAHHLPDAIANYLPTRSTPRNLILSPETDLLETGGGVKLALSKNLLATRAPFIAANADILWTDQPHAAHGTAIDRLIARWNELADAVDVLLLLTPADKAWGHDSANRDYSMNAQGQLTRLSNPTADYIFAGVQITRPELYDGYQPGDRFSNLEIFDAAQKNGRLYGVVHEGGWYHFSTPQSLQRFAMEVA